MNSGSGNGILPGVKPKSLKNEQKKMNDATTANPPGSKLGISSTVKMDPKGGMQPKTTLSAQGSQASAGANKINGNNSPVNNTISSSIVGYQGIGDDVSTERANQDGEVSKTAEEGAGGSLARSQGTSQSRLCYPTDYKGPFIVMLEPLAEASASQPKLHPTRVGRILEPWLKQDLKSVLALGAFKVKVILSGNSAVEKLLSMSGDLDKLGLRASVPAHLTNTQLVLRNVPLDI